LYLGCPPLEPKNCTRELLARIRDPILVAASTTVDVVVIIMMKGTQCVVELVD
jgi:hypothetical protein